MKTPMKSGLAMAVGVVLTCGIGVLAAAPAAAATPASLVINGDVHLTPTIRILHIDANGQRTAGGTTTGTYRATVLDGARRTPIVITGPVTCISTTTQTASLVYPISAIAPLPTVPGLKDAYAIQISVRKASASHSAQVGVKGPLPTGSFHGCLPGPTPMQFTGTILTS